MQLISSAASPFVRKVHVVLHETGQIADVEVLGVKTSPVITRFLDARAGGKLYPEARIWDVLTLEATADGIMEAAVLMTYERRIRPPEMVFEPWIEAQWAKVSRALDTLNDRWMSHLEGPLCMGQLAVGCALGYLDFRHDARQWRKDRGTLDDWYAAFSQRPSMVATAPTD